MTALGHFTREEILSQPEAWRNTLKSVRAHADDLRALWRDGRYQQIVLTGCGSPHYIALSAAALLRELGLPAEGAPASEVWLNPRAAYAQDKRTLLVALSRSGRTSEILRACEAFATRKHGDVLTMSCYPDAPLASAGKLNLLIAAGQERSLAQTRGFTTLLISAMACGAVWAGRDEALDELARLPDVCGRVLAGCQREAAHLGEDMSFDRFYFLGNGAQHGLARELSLKLKEMSISHSESFHFLEFRHGPQTMVTPSALVVGLVSEANRSREMDVLRDQRGLGGRTFSLGERDCDVNFASGVSEWARAPLYLPAGQWLAYARAIKKGADPDTLHNLNAWVKL